MESDGHLVEATFLVAEKVFALRVVIGDEAEDVSGWMETPTFAEIVQPLERVLSAEAFGDGIRITELGGRSQVEIFGTGHDLVVVNLADNEGPRVGGEAVVRVQVLHSSPNVLQVVRPHVLHDVEAEPGDAQVDEVIQVRGDGDANCFAPLVDVAKSVNLAVPDRRRIVPVHGAPFVEIFGNIRNAREVASFRVAVGSARSIAGHARHVIDHDVGINSNSDGVATTCHVGERRFVPRSCD